MSKDLQYYLDNPNELPDDPAVLAALAEQMTGTGVSDPAEGAEKDVKKEEPAPSSEEPKKAEAKTEEVKTDDEPKAVATRDGKGTIPYEVLKTERERRQAAETAVADLTNKVEEIQAQLAKGTAKADTKAEQLSEEALATMSQEDLEALRSDFPVFGNIIDKLMGTITTLSSEVNALKQTEQTREADTRRTVTVSVQDLIDNEPVLVHLQTQDPQLFAKAVEIDNTLKGDSRYPDMATRFAKVAEIMETTFGPFEGVVSKKAATTTKEELTVSKEEAREAALKKVAATKATPKSMSDIPAGDMPESDELTQMENLSPAEISDRLMKMSSDQRTAFLNRF